ncbi:MAG: response regulator [Nitrospinota bacterium]|nr:response regulator [Nitrospinota bacterium]
MPHKILIVEDNEKNHILLIDVLRHFNYEVIEAADGSEGIRMANENMPDLILMDIQMPVMDGLSAVKILKENPKTKGIKVIALTSFAMKGDKEKCLSAGFDAYMPKPIDPVALPEIIRKFLN